MMPDSDGRTFGRESASDSLNSKNDDFHRIYPASIMTSVAHIFQDAIRSSSNHRKNTVALRKLHLRKGRSLEQEFCQCVLHILPIKKGNPEAERAVKFLTAYLDAVTAEVNGEVPENAKELADSLIYTLLTLLLKGFKAKDKVVRYRVCQIVGILLNPMDELDDDTFHIVRDQLMERTRDKEATVRMQAAIALSRLQEGGDEEEDKVIRECLINMLQYDTSADVRKAVLWNIEVNSATLPYILQRVRDVDAQVRKLAFSKVGDDVEKMTFLTVDERDSLLHNGLSDRDTNVQKSCLKMLCERWVPECNDDLIDFLRRMDVINGHAAESAAKAYLLANPSLTIPYDEETWSNLDVEEAFFLRTAIGFFAENKMEEELEAALPPLLHHSELLQRYGLLLAQSEDAEERMALSFILKQLLLTAEMQDFTDEMGRREILVSLRDMLSSIDLSKDNILIVVSILKTLSLNESDFTRIIIEVLYTIYDVDMTDPQSTQEADTSQTEGMDEVEKSVLLLKCLDIIGCVLECTEQDLRDNASMNGILDSFILPSLKSDHPAIQQTGLQCLSLACLLDKSLAQAHLPLFMSAFNDSRQELSVLALKVFFDLTILFGTDLLSDQGLLTELISETLQCDDQELLTLAVEGAAKLMMLRYLTNQTVLQQLVVLYFHPHTKSMNRLRQCLSYFLPVFAHASHANQALLQTVVVPCLQILIQEYAVSKDAMIQPTQIGQQLVDWTDVRKVVQFEQKEETMDEGLHGDMAIELLQAAVQEDDPGTQKIYCQLLNRLHIGIFVGIRRLCQIAELLCSFLEALPKNSPVLIGLRKFARFIADIEEDKLEHHDEEEFLEKQKLTVLLGELRMGLGGPQETEVGNEEE